MIANPNAFDEANVDGVGPELRCAIARMWEHGADGQEIAAQVEDAVERAIGNTVRLKCTIEKRETPA